MLSTLPKIVIYAAVIAMLTTLWWSKLGGIPIIAACLFLVIEVVGLVECYKAAKAYGGGTEKPEPEPEKGALDKAASALRGVIIFAGMILCAAQNAAGMIIWIGVIVCWFASGVIVEHVADIPLKMTYGGWKVDRKRRRRK